jgi:hypothetical protein
MILKYIIIGWIWAKTDKDWWRSSCFLYCSTRAISGVMVVEFHNDASVSRRSLTIITHKLLSYEDRTTWFHEKSFWHQIHILLPIWACCTVLICFNFCWDLLLFNYSKSLSSFFLFDIFHENGKFPMGLIVDAKHVGKTSIFSDMAKNHMEWMCVKCVFWRFFPPRFYTKWEQLLPLSGKTLKMAKFSILFDLDSQINNLSIRKH